MESDMNTAPGAGNLGQAPEREEGDYRVSEEEYRDENLQGSIDVIIEEWKSPEFVWWASTPEGGIALQLMFQVGQKIGEYRARKNRPTPQHQPGIGDPHPSDETAAAVADENERLRAELEEARAALEAQKAADTAQNPAGYDPGVTAPGEPDVAATHDTPADDNEPQPEVQS